MYQRYSTSLQSPPVERVHSPAIRAILNSVARTPIKKLIDFTKVKKQNYS